MFCVLIIIVIVWSCWIQYVKCFCVSIPMPSNLIFANFSSFVGVRHAHAKFWHGHVKHALFCEKQARPCAWPCMCILSQAQGRYAHATCTPNFDKYPNFAKFSCNEDIVNFKCGGGQIKIFNLNFVIFQLFLGLF